MTKKTAGTKVAVRQPTNDLFNLENDLCNAVHMAYIAGRLVETNLTNKRTQEKLTGRPNTYYIGDEEVDAMLHAIYETHNQIRALRDRYLQALPSVSR
jgi:hypothetical protein